MKGPISKSRELKIVLAIGLLLAVLSSLPYISGYINRPSDGRFLWMTFNIDDFCVYLSWTRQVADGHLLMRNLFTNDVQPSLQFNLLFTLAGLLVRITGLPPIAVLHILRVLLGIALVWAVWRLSGLYFEDARERLALVGLLAFSSGFGWMFRDSANRMHLPVDRWQPEALVFLSSYLNPLFLAGLALMVGAVYHLVKMRREGRVRNAVTAGLFLLALGNVHTYDLASLGLGWGVYLVILTATRAKLAWRTVGLSGLAAAMALPSIGYQFYVYRADAVFRARANTPAESPALSAYLLGFGLIVPLAVVGAWLAVRGRRSLVPVCWAAAGFAAPYIPFAQQRKFVMGLQIPLVFLAVIAFSALLKRLEWKNWAALTVLLVVMTIPTNVIFMRRDVWWMAQDKTAPRLRPYLADCELRSLDWIRQYVPRDGTVLCSPDAAAYIPAFAGRQVYLGHWSETPDFSSRVSEWSAFVDERAPDEWRREWLADRGISYVWNYEYGADVLRTRLGMVRTLSGRPFLKQVHRDGPVVIYRFTPADMSEATADSPPQVSRAYAVPVDRRLDL